MRAYQYYHFHWLLTSAHLASTLEADQIPFTQHKIAGLKPRGGLRPAILVDSSGGFNPASILTGIPFTHIKLQAWSRLQSPRGFKPASTLDAVYCVSSNLYAHFCALKTSSIVLENIALFFMKTSAIGSVNESHANRAWPIIWLGSGTWVV